MMQELWLVRVKMEERRGVEAPCLMDGFEIVGGGDVGIWLLQCRYANKFRESKRVAV